MEFSIKSGKAEKLDDLEEGVSDQLQERKDGITQNAKTQAEQNLGDMNTFDQHIDTLKTFGDEKAITELKGKMHFFNDPVINQKVLLQNDYIKNIDRRILNGSIDEDGVNKLLENRMITYQQANDYKNRLNENNSGIGKSFSKAKSLLTEKFSQHIFSGAENTFEHISNMVQNSGDFSRKEETTKLYETELNMIQKELQSGMIKDDDGLQKRIKDIDNKITGKLTLDSQNTNQLQENMSMVDMVKGINDLKNGTGIFFGHNQDVIKSFIKKKYA